MSVVISSEGSARNSSHVHRLGSSISPVIVKSHSSKGVRGVGPAERTGNPSTRYWPGGRRESSSVRLRRPRKPREKNPSLIPPPSVIESRRKTILHPSTCEVKLLYPEAVRRVPLSDG